MKQALDQLEREGEKRGGEGERDVVNSSYRY